MGGWRSTGILRRAPAHLGFNNRLLERKEAARCSTCTLVGALPRGDMAGDDWTSQDSRQELLWQRFFLDPSLWWDNRHDKRSSRSPDFRHKESQEVLWVDKVSKPAWVDAQLAALDLHGGPWSSWSVPDYCKLGRPLMAETVRRLCSQGQIAEAVEGLGGLVQAECCITQSLLYVVLRECVARKDLHLGRRVHALSEKRGLEWDTFLCNHILRMYASHGRLQEAVNVFDMVKEPDAFTWSAMISTYVTHGQYQQAIHLYHRLRSSLVKPNGHVFVAALQACAKGVDLKSGQKVHADVLASGVEPDLFVSSGLVDMYSKCGSLGDALRVFDGLPQKDLVTWSAMIAGYSQQGMGKEALGLLRAMQEQGIVALDSATFVSVLQACASVGIPALEQGRQLHAEIRERRLQADVFVASSLVNMYAKCGSLEDARGVFAGLDKRNVVTWNAIIAGYSQRGMGQEAFHLYKAMHEEGMVRPNSVTYVCLLQACSSLGTSALDMGKELHAHIGQQDLQNDTFVANSLVSMYAKCGSIEDAQVVFEGLAQKDVVTWNSMIAAYSQKGMGLEALRLLSAMQQEGMSTPTAVTFLSLLQACASVGTQALEKGKQFHAQIREQGLLTDVCVANSLVNMYAKCGSLEDARGLFNGLGQKNVGTWNAMIAAFYQQGMDEEALDLYHAMVEEGVAAPDAVTFVSLLQVCANVAALHIGRRLHAQIEEQGLEADMIVAHSLVSMYGKCGSMAEAQQVFDNLHERDVGAWNALIAGYTRQGDSQVVFHLYDQMREDGMNPTGSTFLSLLTVCSHAGLVNLGQELFHVMRRDYGIRPTVEHYTCMVDLLSRAGQLDEALSLGRTMSVLPDAAVWHTLLGACRKWGNVEVGRQAFHEALKLDNKDAAAYVSMSNIYSSAHMWEQAQEIQTRRIKIRAWKQPGQSWWTDMNGLVHSFLVRGYRVQTFCSILATLYSMGNV